MKNLINFNIIIRQLIYKMYYQKASKCNLIIELYKEKRDNIPNLQLLFTEILEDFKYVVRMLYFHNLINPFHMQACLNSIDAYKDRLKKSKEIFFIASHPIFFIQIKYHYTSSKEFTFFFEVMDIYSIFRKVDNLNPKLYRINIQDIPTKYNRKKYSLKDNWNRRISKFKYTICTYISTIQPKIKKII